MVRRPVGRPSCLLKHPPGPVSISTTDCPTGRRIIVPCYLSIAEWSDVLIETPPGACFNKHDDCPTGRRIIVPCYLSIAEWSDVLIETPPGACFNKHDDCPTDHCPMLFVHSRMVGCPVGRQSCLLKQAPGAPRGWTQYVPGESVMPSMWAGLPLFPFVPFFRPVPFYHGVSGSLLSTTMPWAEHSLTM